MVERLKGRVHKWLVAAIVLVLVLGGVALIKANSGSATSESTVRAGVEVGGGAYGGARKKEKEKEKDSEEKSEGKACGLAGGPGACSE